MLDVGGMGGVAVHASPFFDHRLMLDLGLVNRLLDLAMAIQTESLALGKKQAVIGRVVGVVAGGAARHDRCMDYPAGFKRLLHVFMAVGAERIDISGYFTGTLAGFFPIDCPFMAHRTLAAGVRGMRSKRLGIVAGRQRINCGRTPERQKNPGERQRSNHCNRPDKTQFQHDISPLEQ